MPTYHSDKKTLVRTVESILQQKYLPKEIIVIDDNGLCDYQKTTKEVQKLYPDALKIFFNKENMGANYSRNKGIKEATGKYIAFMDADDTWDKNYLEECASIIEKCQALFITTNYQIIHKDGVLPPAFNKSIHESGNISNKELFRDYVGPTSTVVVEREVLMKAGLFDIELPARQDYDMWIRTSQIVPLFYNFKPLVKIYRDGHASISSSYKRNVQGTKMVLQKILAQKNITDDEKIKITASQYKHMALACILGNAYKEAREYAYISLKWDFDFTLSIWYILCFFPSFFRWLRTVRKKRLYRKNI